MPYTLTDFCADLSSTLKSKGESGLPDVAQKLSELLKNPAFVSETFAEDEVPVCLIGCRDRLLALAPAVAGRCGG